MATAPLIVPDVNVIVSGTTIVHTPPVLILQAWRERRVQIATSLPILADLRRVLQYPKVIAFTQMTAHQSEQLVTDLQNGAYLVPGVTPVSVSPDPTNNKLFTCALEAQADFLISGDKDHVLSIAEFHGVKTISPRTFVETVLAQQKAA